MTTSRNNGYQCQTVSPQCVPWAKKHPLCQPLPGRCVWSLLWGSLANHPLCCSRHPHCALWWNHQPTIIFQCKKMIALVKWCWYSVFYQAGAAHITRQLLQNLPDNKSCNADKSFVYRATKPSGKVTVNPNNGWNVSKWRWKLFSSFSRGHLHCRKGHSIILRYHVAWLTRWATTPNHQTAEDGLGLACRWIIVPAPLVEKHTHKTYIKKR